MDCVWSQWKKEERWSILNGNFQHQQMVILVCDLMHSFYHFGPTRGLCLTFNAHPASTGINHSALLLIRN